jgi:hypothetical protein
VVAILLVIAGGLQPVLDAAGPGRGEPAWGYVLLALAAACVGFDRFFGLSSGWMRNMTTAQALRRRLELLQYDWAVECAKAATRTVDGKQILTRVGLLRAFADDAAVLMQQETSEWVSEFQSNLGQLETSAGRPSLAAARPRPPSPARATPPVLQPPRRPGRRPRRRVGRIGLHPYLPAARRPDRHADRPRPRAGRAAQAARRREGVPLTWTASSGSWRRCGSRPPRRTSGTTRSARGG